MIDIPFSFYLKYSIKVTLMAMGTCFVLGYMFFGIGFWPLGPAIAILGPPILIFKHFWNRRNGALEYIYRNDLLKQKTRSFIISQYGLLKYLSIIELKLGGWAATPQKKHIAILEDKNLQVSNEVRYFLSIEVGRFFVRVNDYIKAIEYFKAANELLEDRLVGNVKLAQTFEFLGDVGQATSYYQKATTDPLNSEKLNKYLLTQVDRVKEKGPCKQPSTLVARYMLR